MVFKGKMNTSKLKRAYYILYLARNNKLSTKEIMKECCVSRATVYRIKKEDLIEENETRPRKHAGGDPKNLERVKKGK